jgi:hypothetical protein
MTNKPEFSMYQSLTFDDFRRLANDPSLTRHQKVGFPDSYRDGKEQSIFTDISNKLNALSQVNKVILEIGPGCSGLPIMLSELCQEAGHQLIFVDSDEMLDHLPNHSNITKYAGTFPSALGDELHRLSGSVDAIIAYSVIQYVFIEANLWRFLDTCLALLADGGEILLGDIPNISMRKRFFDSNSGIYMHQQFTGKDEKPNVAFNNLEPDHIDDSVVLAVLMRARSQGFHAWVFPQDITLPMANRREDILIRKP